MTKYFKEHIEQRQERGGPVTIFANATVMENRMESQCDEALCTVEVGGVVCEGRIRGNFKFLGYAKFWPLGANFEVDIYGLRSKKIRRFNMFRDKVEIMEPDKQDDKAWEVIHMINRFGEIVET